MDNIIVYLDDANYALHQLAPMENGSAEQKKATHWILVACAPRMSRHISKWVNHSARQNWRAKWSEKVFNQITPTLRKDGSKVTEMLATGPLVELTKQLQAKHGAARVLDARRAKFGQDLPPVTEGQPTAQEARWSVPGAVAGMGALLVLASE